MSCENDNVEYWRLVQKYSTITGVSPTIPPSQDHSDGTWSDTDLYIGEFFMNVTDNLLWYRTIDGIHLVSGTGGSASFVGDYVPTSGGTYSGGVFAPTFSSNTITSALITASAFDGQIFGSSGSVYYGDGSNLTGIVVSWNGGTVSNPVSFQNDVTFENPVEINGPISTVNAYVDFQSDLWVNGGVSASYFVGDGSGLTGITATYSDTYTTDAYLQGASIYFDRTDGTASYFVDLTPILSTYSILDTTWDPNTSEFQITTIGGDTFTETINEFATLNVLTSVTAQDFYGTLHGTFSGDIYTTSATLYGTDAVFSRTDGITYSLDLSSFSGVGPTGPAGPTGATGSTPYMVISYNSTGLTLATGSVTLPVTETLYIGWNTGTRVRIWNDSTHYMEGQITTAMTYPQVAGNDITVDIDYVVGTGTFGVWLVGVAGDPGSMGASASQTLAQTLLVGNNSGNTNIIFNNHYGLENVTGEADIKMDNNQIDITHQKITGSDWKRGLFQGSGHNGVASITGDEYNVTSDFYRVGSVDVTNTYSKIYFQDTTISTGNTYQTAIRVYKDNILVNSDYNYSTPNPNFTGLQYHSDYSANYTNRSLVDKEYVDTHSGGSGITYSGQADYLTFFDTNDSLSYTGIHYNSGKYIIGWGSGWAYENTPTLGVYSPYITGPAIIGESSQFGGLFIASGAATGQTIGLQGQASGSTVVGNLGVYGQAGGTMSSNTGGYFTAADGTIYPGYSGFSNLGVDVSVSSLYSTGAVGLTNSGINILVSGRVGDNNYIGQLRDGSEGVGKVLTCISSDGLATWQTPTGGGTTSFIPEVSGSEVFRGQTHRNNSTTIDTYGGVSTSTSASTQAQSVSTTDFRHRSIKLRYYASVVSTGRYTGVRGSSQQFWSITGGFRYVCDFAISDNADSSNTQTFMGLAAQNTDLGYATGTTLVSALTNLIGVGNDSTDTNLQIIHNDASGTATKIDLGANFPCQRTGGSNITAIYSVVIYNECGSSDVKVQVTNKGTGDVAQHTLTTDLPSTTSLLNFFASRGMGSPVTNTGEFYLYKLGVYHLV